MGRKDGDYYHIPPPHPPFRRGIKKELQMDNEGCVITLRHISHVHFLRRIGSKINVGKGEIAFNKHE